MATSVEGGVTNPAAVGRVAGYPSTAAGFWTVEVMNFLMSMSSGQLAAMYALFAAVRGVSAPLSIAAYCWK